MAGKKITVTLGRFASPPSKKAVAEGATVGEFLKENGINFSSSVKVNVQLTKASYVLQKDDWVTIAGAASEGGK